MLHAPKLLSPRVALYISVEMNHVSIVFALLATLLGHVWRKICRMHSKILSSLFPKHTLISPKTGSALSSLLMYASYQISYPLPDTMTHLRAPSKTSHLGASITNPQTPPSPRRTRFFLHSLADCHMSSQFLCLTGLPLACHKDLQLCMHQPYGI